MKSFPFSGGIARQLLVVLLLVAGLSVSGLGLMAYSSERTALREQIVHQQMALAELKEHELQTWLLERGADMELLAVNHLNQEHFSELFDPNVPAPRKVEFSAFLADNLRGLQRARTGYIRIAMVDTLGNVRISTDDATVGLPSTHQPLLIRALASPTGSAIQDIYLNPQTGRPEMAWAHRILAIDLETKLEKSAVIGILVAVVDVEKTIYPLLGPLSLLGDSAETLLTRREGDEIVFLSHLLFYDGDPLTLRIPATTPSGEPAIRSTRGESGVIEARDYRGAPVLAAYRPVGDGGWGFIVKQDQAQAFAPIRDLTQRMLAWATLILLGTGLLALFLSNRMTRPLTQLVQVSQDVAAGNLDIQFPAERQDEIGALSHSFQEMVHALRQRQKQEAALTRILELLNSSPDFLEVFRGVADELRAHLKFAQITLFVFDDGAQTFQLLVTDPPLRGEVAHAFSVKQTPVATVMQANYFHFARDLAENQPSALERLLYQEGVRSHVAAPLRVENKTVGMVSLGWAVVAGYDPDKLSLLEQVIGSLALALERWRLFSKVQHQVDELAQAYTELQQADQLKGEFIRNITHELKTPVTIVSGFAELLLYDEYKNLSAEQVEMLTTIDTHSKHLAHLVNDVVVLDRLQTQTRQEAPVLIAELAEQSLAEIRNRIGTETNDRFRFVFECPDRVLAVQGDAEQLARVFANLLNNAVKFSPEGGKVSIAIQPLDGLPMAERQNSRDASSYHPNGSGKTPERWIQVAISDEGIGIPFDKRDAVWGRFVQLDGSTTRRFGGTGLGLALVREVVEAHGGYAWIDSTLDTGTTVFFVLPSCEGCSETMPDFQSSPASAQANGSIAGLFSVPSQAVPFTA